MTVDRGIIALVLLTLLVYANGLGGGFVWDDEYTFLDNPRILHETVRSAFTTEVFSYMPHNALAPHYQHYRPLHLLAYSWLARLTGVSPFGLHLASLLLHAACGVLVFLLILEYAGIRIAWFTAALFLVNPLHVEAVAWMSSLSEVLAAMLMLASLYTLVQARKGKGWLLGISYVLATAAFLTKETSLALPLLAAVLVGWWAWPYFLLAAGTLMMRFAVLGWVAPPTLHRSLFGHLRVALIACLGYARKLIWPWPLAPEYQVSHSVLAWVLFALGCVLAAWAAWKYSRIRLALLLVILPLSPALAVSISLPALRLVQDRNAYLAVLGLAFLSGLATRWRAGAAAALALIVLWGTLSVLAIRNWRDPEALWTHTLEVTPNSRTAILGLGDWYFSTQRFADAERVYRQGLALRPDDPDYLKSQESVRKAQH